MWKLALVQGPNVTFFDASGVQRKSFTDFPTAVAAVLKDGYEPFGADSVNTVLIWFRLRVA
jgi:hypothetical protein